MKRPSEIRPLRVSYRFYPQGYPQAVWINFLCQKVDLDVRGSARLPAYHAQQDSYTNI